MSSRLKGMLPRVVKTNLDGVNYFGKFMPDAAANKEIDDSGQRTSLWIQLMKTQAIIMVLLQIT